MKNKLCKYYMLGCVVAVIGLLFPALVYGQLRTPPKNVKDLAVDSGELQESWQSKTENPSAMSAKPEKIPDMKVAQTAKAYSQEVTVTRQQPEITPKPIPTTSVTPAPTNAVTAAPVVSNVSSISNVTNPPQPSIPAAVSLTSQTSEPQTAPQIAGLPPGTIVIPVTIPMYVPTVVNQPAQLVIPQQYPMMFPQPYPQYLPSYPPQFYPPQNFPPYPYAADYGYNPMPPQPVQQPIPTRMILPDGSTVSIKHYMPGSFLRNAFRAVTP